MKSKILIALAAIAAAFNWQAGAQTYDTNNVVVQTFAGSGFSGHVDGVGQQAMFHDPRAIVADSSGKLFVWDYNNGCIRKITPDGTVTTFAGGGIYILPGYGTNVSLDAGYYSSMIIDHSGALRVLADRGGVGLYLLRVGTNAYVSEINLGLAANGGPYGICVDSQNNVYCANGAGNRIYRYRTNGVLEVFAGSGNTGSADGNGIFTSFTIPGALAADDADNIYVWDSGNHLIRRINQNRDVVTIAGKLGVAKNADGVGTKATFNGITSMCSDNSGNIYLAAFGATGTSDFPGSAIRKMTATTNVTTLAGSFAQAGYTNGLGASARFDWGGVGYGNGGICLSQGMIFVADQGNQRIRNITFNPSTQPVLPAYLQFSTSTGLQIVGTVGRTYRVESSPDMTNWTTQTTLLLTSSPYLWIDQAPMSGNKFYRAFLLP
jgi:hypothetical protein